MKDHGYTYIVAWGKMLGSHASYVQEECERARADKAPANAIYKGGDGTWETTDRITNPGTRFTLGLPPLSGTEEIVLDGYEGELLSKKEATGKDNFLYTIRFATIHSATAWARQHALSHEVTLQCPVNFIAFDQPVTVEYLPDR